MGRLVNRLIQAVIYGIVGAALGYVLLAGWQMLFESSALTYSFTTKKAQMGALVFGIIGAIMGYQRR